MAVTGAGGAGHRLTLRRRVKQAISAKLAAEALR